MLKRISVLALGIAALAALCWSGPAVAMLSANGINLGNGIGLANEINLPNGQALPDTTALQPVRLTMPDGTEVDLR